MAFASPHERVMTPVEQAGLRSPRRRLLAQAHGVVVDLGGGTGDHLTLYPPTVSTVTIVEPDTLLAPLVSRRAAACTVPVFVSAEPLTAIADASVDVVVANFVLCSVPSLPAVLGEVSRVLRPGGRLLFCEHVPGRGARRFVSDLVAPMWATMVPGCRLGRDLPAELRLAGFDVTDLERFRLLTPAYPIQTCAAGVARMHHNPD